MVARLSNARCMFDSCWFELTSLDMASHGPRKLRHNPIAWSVTVYATKLYQLAVQYAITKCNRDFARGFTNSGPGGAKGSFRLFALASRGLEWERGRAEPPPHRLPLPSAPLEEGIGGGRQTPVRLHPFGQEFAPPFSPPTHKHF
jgi:hypothetical protein